MGQLPDAVVVPLGKLIDTDHACNPALRNAFTQKFFCEFLFRAPPSVVPFFPIFMLPHFPQGMSGMIFLFFEEKFISQQNTTTQKQYIIRLLGIISKIGLEKAIYVLQKVGMLR